MSSSPSQRRLSWSDLWVRDQTVRHVVRKMRKSSLSNTPPSEPDDPSAPSAPSAPDFTLTLSDQTLTLILSLLPHSQLKTNSLVSKRWLKLSGKLINSITLLDWEFLESGRVLARFPNVVFMNLVPACIRHVSNSGIRVSNGILSVNVDSTVSESLFLGKEDLLSSSLVDRGIRVLAEGCLNLRKLVVMNASEVGLDCVSEKCGTLQELELHCCGDMALMGISGCRNLQILKIVGFVEGFYESVVSDIGLTIVAQGCRRLVRLELVGCEGSYDGIKAIGQCCQMLEEITFSNHKMDGGWLAALSYCTNLKTLKLHSCKNVDLSPGPDEYLGTCTMLEELHLRRCQMRDKTGVRALFLACQAVRELVFEDCWGLDDNILQIASVCRRVRLLSLEGCSLLTMVGLDALVLSWVELNRLRVVSCNNIKDSEITPALASLFCVLKELKWRPDSKSLLAEGLAGTGLGMKKGGRTFKRV